MRGVSAACNTQCHSTGVSPRESAQFPTGVKEVLAVFEGWHLWKKSMRMRRQALRRAVVSGPRRDCLASVLVVLLTGTLLLGTSAFGGVIPALEVCVRLYDATGQVSDKCREYLGDLFTDPEGYPLPEPDPGCVIGYDEASQKVIMVCDTTPLNRPPSEQERFARNHPPCKAHHMNDWWAVKRMCFDGANRENLLQCIMWRHPFYTNPYVQGGMQIWQTLTAAEAMLCAMGHLHACGSAVQGWIGKRLVKWLAPKIPVASEPVCKKLADIGRACESYATQEVCGGRTWRGEGTIQFDIVHYKSPYHGLIAVEEDLEFYHQIRMDGPFDITFGVKDDMIQGEGFATLTLAEELHVSEASPGQCTVNGRDTVPLSVSGMYENGKLKLMFASSPKEYHRTASCSGELAPAVAWFHSNKFVEVVFGVFFNQNNPLVIDAEDGAEGRLVEDFSEQARQDGVEPPGMWTRSFSIRLKSLPDH
jgi:hypothetical protein